MVTKLQFLVFFNVFKHKKKSARSARSSKYRRTPKILKNSPTPKKFGRGGPFPFNIWGIFSNICGKNILLNNSPHGFFMLNFLSLDVSSQYTLQQKYVSFELFKLSKKMQYWSIFSSTILFFNHLLFLKISRKDYFSCCNIFYSTVSKQKTKVLYLLSLVYIFCIQSCQVAQYNSSQEKVVSLIYFCESS
eukprot:TRINITY_DN2243_c0_g1_i1.p1 TRINITY_DN2243_c0_g1~~TRINITY_DN2243_c0_g1_i1.p1  ORF type:complete len:190 (-),score=5.24 TRINITY_DN2243_c0_g1_i1:114-683(-)